MTETPAPKKSCRLCWGVSLAWMMAVGALMFATWPHIPLDMSGVDPATVAAYKIAVTWHIITYLGVMLAPPLAILILRFTHNSGRT